MILRFFIIILVVSYFTSSFSELTYSTMVTKTPDVFITINSDGTILPPVGNLFNDDIWYPGKQKSGIIRIDNKFSTLTIDEIGVGVNLERSREGFDRNFVYNSFIDNMKLTIKNGRLLVFDQEITNKASLRNLLEGIKLNSSNSISISRNETVDINYTLFMDEKSDNELQNLTAVISFIIKSSALPNRDDPKQPDPEKTGDKEIPLGVLKKEHIQYVHGYPDNTVRPLNNITREEVATVFYRLLDVKYRRNILTLTHRFTDVGKGRWSEKFIATLSNGSIINGYPDGSFRPGNYITRAELAVIASRFDRLVPVEYDKFIDTKGHWAKDYINSAWAKGWVNGYPDGTFKPNQYITRAEFVTMVNNVLDRRVKKEHILPNSRIYPDLSESEWYYEAMMEAINSHHYERLEDGYEKWTELYYPELDM